MDLCSQTQAALPLHPILVHYCDPVLMGIQSVNAKHNLPNRNIPLCQDAGVLGTNQFTSKKVFLWATLELPKDVQKDGVAGKEKVDCSQASLVLRVFTHELAPYKE